MLLLATLRYVSLDSKNGFRSPLGQNRKFCGHFEVLLNKDILRTSHPNVQHIKEYNQTMKKYVVNVSGLVHE